MKVGEKGIRWSCPGESFDDIAFTGTTKKAEMVKWICTDCDRKRDGKCKGPEKYVFKRVKS